MYILRLKGGSRMIIKDIELKKWGNSQGIRLSKDELSELGVTEDQMVFTMVIENGKVILTPKKKEPTSLDDLFTGYTGELLGEQDQYDWGEPIGREVF